MINYYSKAYKKGIKHHKECIQRGEYPFLPALDALLPLEKTVNGIDLGIVTIPLEFIVGTKTVSRQNDFTNNFMPIAKEQSEFADKWESLCQSHLEEGIRDPIIVWEFLNRFYVQEGNKRVSVLKYFDAVNVSARVKRIVPDQIEGNELYFEFLAFYKLTKINFIEFTKPNSYKELLKLVGEYQNETWDDTKIKQFSATYYFFKKNYENLGGNHLDVTVGDAFLAYIKIYGYDSLRHSSTKQMNERLKQVWKEILLQQEKDPIEIKLNPETPKKKVLSNLVLKKRKIAFLFGGNIDSSGWRTYHYRGMQQAKLALNDKIEVKDYVTSLEKIEETIYQCIQDGASIIFTTEANMLDSCVKIAASYPNIKFLNCALNVPHRLVQLYYPRMYEAKFICGAIAGIMSQSDKIGYICRYPIYGTIAEINAFARGVLLVNQNAKIYLEWSNNDDIEVLQDKLVNQGVDIISFREYIHHSSINYRSFGLAKVDGNTLSPLVLPIFNWGSYYEKIIQSILDGTFSDEVENTNKSINYYWGMSSGVVGIIFSEKLPKEVRYLGELIYQSLQSDYCQPFFEPVQGANGNYIWDEVNKALPIDEIINMDTLEKNIIGKIPKYSELDSVVQMVVDEMGVHSSRKEDEDENTSSS